MVIIPLAITTANPSFFSSPFLRIFREKKNKYQEVMMKANNLSQNLEYAARALEPYEEYLE